MKEYIEKNIACPKCGAEGNVRWVKRFVARDEKDLMFRLINESHEVYVCEKCKHERKFSFQIMYYGLTQEVNVNYIPEDEADVWPIMRE